MDHDNTNRIANFGFLAVPSVACVTQMSRACHILTIIVFFTVHALVGYMHTFT